MGALRSSLCSVFFIFVYLLTLLARYIFVMLSSAVGSTCVNLLR